MNLSSGDIGLIRRFLLADLSDDERTQLEWRQSANLQFKELIEAVEEELVDDYARGLLNARDRTLFEKQYLITEGRRQKLREARILAEAFTRQPKFSRMALMTIAVSLGLAVLAFVEPWRRSQPFDAAFILREGVPRDQDDRQSLRFAQNTLLIRLRLQPDSVGGATRAVLQRVGSDEELWRQKVISQPDGSVQVDLPASMLADAHYLLQLEKEGRVTASFAFQVIRE